jgi:hypothetical protein
MTAKIDAFLHVTGLLFWAAPALAQTLPYTLPPNTVVGRPGSIGPGEATAMTMPELASILFEFGLIVPYDYNGMLAQKISPSGSDLVAIQDATTGQLKSVTVSALQSGGIGVGSIDSKTGTFTTAGGIKSTAGNQIELALNSATLQLNPADPPTTSSTVGVMMGFGGTCLITPSYSGRVHVEFHGTIGNSGAANSTVAGVRWGTGGHPVNNDPPIGTTLGTGLTANAPNAGGTVPFAAGGIIIGLTPGVQIWLDLLVSVGSGTGSVTNVSCTAMEF